MPMSVEDHQKYMRAAPARSEHQLIRVLMTSLDQQYGNLVERSPTLNVANYCVPDL
jgi:hypothetical protein